MSEAKKKFLGLFRIRSTSGSKESPPREDRERKHRRERPDGAHHSRHHHDRPHSSNSSPQKQEHRRASAPLVPVPLPVPLPIRTTASPIPPAPVSAPTAQPLSEWPPPGYTRHGSLSQGKAMELVASGVPVFKGVQKSIPHAGDEYYHFYATCSGNKGGTDIGQVYTEAFTAQSMRLQGTATSYNPWETLEQPSMAFYYGTRPGTITLNLWVGLSASINPAFELRDPGVQPREVTLSTILERLIYLEGGFEEDYPDLMYKNLYKNLLRDPHKWTTPHKAMEKQIADLIVILSRKEWIDFSRPENQVVAKFFANATETEMGRYKAFFHQLLLSMELWVRINSKEHREDAKEKLLAQLPPCIRWDLALVRKWRECMSIKKFATGGNPEQIRFNLNHKKEQVKALRKFARAMKWPNLSRVDEVLKDRDVDAVPLEDRSSDAMSYFTGLILPGATLPWLIMNSLIDCDTDAGGNALAALTHIHPHSGFQYRSQTYWSSSSIVGKVLAPTAREIGGWIGPSRPAPDLKRIQIARIRQRKTKLRLTPSDIESMTERSDPLGPPSSSYPISEYQLLLPDRDPYSLTNTIRIEKLALKPISSMSEGDKDKDKPLTYDAAVQFAIDGKSWPLRLSYDVSFVAAHPCSSGPHPLFFDYVYQAVKIDELLTIRDWGNVNANAGSSSRGEESSASASPEGGIGGGIGAEPRDEEKVLLVEAFGVPDNEVLARAWCAHWGLSAVVADVEKTCMSCAIREAYAACLNVVILIDGDTYESDS